MSYQPSTNYSDLVDALSVESELQKYNYQPLQTITASTGPTLVKALNSKGQTVLVMTPEDGYTLERTNDFTIKPIDTELVSSSLCQGAYSAINDLSVSGIAIECADGICIMTRDTESFQSTKSNYLWDQPTEHMVTFLPIITLDQIKSNNDEIIAQSSIVANRVRRENLQRLFQSVESTFNLATQVQTEISQLLQESKQYAAELVLTIEQLHGYLDQYEKIPQPTDLQLSKQELTVKNLAIRLSNANKLMYLLEVVQEQQPILANVSAVLTEAQNILRQDYQSVHNVISS
jgi:hypothetical protein